jgi:adenylosuccinate lyase
MRSERINSLARYVLSVEGNANQTHSVQYFERTLDDSANRRLTIPESFLAADAILLLMANIASGLEVHPSRIRQRMNAELPFMATEKIIVDAVSAGADRQEVHEVIRRHAIEAARDAKDNAAENNLLDRLAKDPAIRLDRKQLALAADPAKYVGRAPEQVDEFLREVIEPLLAGVSSAPQHEEIRV